MALLQLDKPEHQSSASLPVVGGLPHLFLSDCLNILLVIHNKAVCQTWHQTTVYLPFVQIYIHTFTQQT